MNFRCVPLLMALACFAAGASAQTPDASPAAPQAATAQGSAKFTAAQQKASQRIEKRMAKLERAKACVAEAQTMKALRACDPKGKETDKEKSKQKAKVEGPAAG